MFSIVFDNSVDILLDCKLRAYYAKKQEEQEAIAELFRKWESGEATMEDEPIII